MLTANPPANKALNHGREGMILLATLIIMLIITIMGAGLLFTSQVEYTTTSTYRQNLIAYNNADALARLAIRVADVIVYGTAEDVRDHLTFSDDSDFVLELNEDSLNTLNADLSSGRLSVKDRYLRLGSGNETPDVTVKDKNGRVIGTIMISHDMNRSTSSGSATATPGASAGISDHASSGSGIVTMQNYVITVSGKDPVYQAKSFFDDDENMVSGPQTFITILYSVVKSL
jgi:type II secretory pathway pseudopilin PulG